MRRGKHNFPANYGVQYEGKAKGPPAKQAKQGYGSSLAKAKQGQDVCTYYHKLGHKAENCFKLHPDQRPQKKRDSTKQTEYGSSASSTSAPTRCKVSHSP